MTDDDIRAMLERYHGNPTEISGLPELNEAMRVGLGEDLDRLRYACRAILEEIPTLEALDAQRSHFARLYALLKLAAVSSINLLDAPSPSLPTLTLDEPFRVQTEPERVTFTVF